MREVMRFAGPRMLARHPWLAIMHLIDDRRPPPPLPSVKPHGRKKETADSDRDKLTQ
jgi:hypothetical protein